MSFIKHGDINYQSSNQPAFAQAKEETSDYKTLKCLDCSHADVDNAPCNHKAWKILSGSKVLDEPVAWKRNEDIRDVKHN